MKRKDPRIGRKLLGIMTIMCLLSMLVLPSIAYAATSAKLHLTTDAQVDSVKLVLSDRELQMRPQGNHWTTNDGGTYVTGSLVGIKIVFKIGDKLIEKTFLPDRMSAEGQGSINMWLTVNLKDIEGPEEPDDGENEGPGNGENEGPGNGENEGPSNTPVNYYSTLTVHYVLAGSDPVQYLRDPDVFNRLSGTTLTVTAPEFEGYVLGSQSTYTHNFTSQDAAYTFLYDKIVEIEEPDVPAGQPAENDKIDESIEEVEIAEEEVPLAAPTLPLNELPQAGGAASEMFYVIGLALVSAGAIMLKRKK